MPFQARCFRKEMSMKWLKRLLGLMVFICAVFFISLRLLGFQSYVVLSGSMAPSIPVGSLLYTQRVQPKDLRVKEVITFQEGTMTVTHRIVSIHSDGVQTKGDANESIDAKRIPFSAIKGRLVFSLPYVGYFLITIQTPPYSYVVGLALFIFLTWIFWPRKSSPNLEEE